MDGRIPEGLDTELLTDNGFEITYGSSDGCMFRKETKAGIVNGFYTIDIYRTNTKNYQVSMCFSKKEFPPKIKEIVGQLEKELEGARKQTEEAVARIKADTGVTSDNFVLGAKVEIESYPGIYTHGNDFAKVYSDFQKTAEILGIDLSAKQAALSAA